MDKQNAFAIIDMIRFDIDRCLQDTEETKVKANTNYMWSLIDLSNIHEFSDEEASFHVRKLLNEELWTLRNKKNAKVGDAKVKDAEVKETETLFQNFVGDVSKDQKTINDITLMDPVEEDKSKEENSIITNKKMETQEFPLDFSSRDLDV